RGAGESICRIERSDPGSLRIVSSASAPARSLANDCDDLSHSVAVQAPWWSGLDLRVLRHVRGVLRRRELELELVARRPEEPAAFAAISGDDPDGAGLAVFAPQLSPSELDLIPSMLGEAPI